MDTQTIRHQDAVAVVIAATCAAVYAVATMSGDGRSHTLRTFSERSDAVAYAQAWVQGDYAAAERVGR